VGQFEVTGDTDPDKIRVLIFEIPIEQ